MESYTAFPNEEEEATLVDFFDLSSRDELYATRKG
jgi:hypothetical protein